MIGEEKNTEEFANSVGININRFNSRDCEGRSGKAPPFRVGMKAEPFAHGSVYG